MIPKLCPRDTEMAIEIGSVDRGCQFMVLYANGDCSKRSDLSQLRVTSDRVFAGITDSSVSPAECVHPLPGSSKPRGYIW